MTAFSLGAHLPLGANSDLALSLPQSRLLSFGRATSLLRGRRGGAARRGSLRFDGAGSAHR